MCLGRLLQLSNHELRMGRSCCMGILHVDTIAAHIDERSTRSLRTRSQMRQDNITDERDIVDGTLAFRVWPPTSPHALVEVL